MADVAPSSRRVRFGPFEADLHTRELRKHGMRLRLQEQPFQILAMLLERSGELVTREEIRAKLWPEDTFVDFDHGLNAAIRRLREALNDSAETPRFVETLPRRGYRFLMAVEALAPPDAVAAKPKGDSPASAGPPTVTASTKRSFAGYRLWIGSILMLAAIAAVVWILRPSATAIESVAILPLLNETKDPSLDYLTDGIAETVLDNLAQVPTLKVASRNAAFVYRGRAVDPKSLAHELGVRAVLLGSLRASPPTPVSKDDVRLEVELVDTQNNRRLWGEQYTIHRLQFNEVQSQISDRVTENLALHLSANLRRKVTHRHTENNAAFDAYLHGRYLIDTRQGVGAYREALGYFREAMDLDPNYALAYTGAASAYGLLSFYSGMSPSESLPAEQAAIEHALRLDPELADAHMQSGYLLQTFHRDLAGAEREFLRAAQLQPNSGQIHHALALHYSLTGRTNEALAEARRSAELEPSLPPSMGTALWIEYFAHDFDRLGELLRNMNDADAHCMRALQREAIGDYAQALIEIGKVNWFGDVCSVPHVYAVAGRQPEARKILNHLLAKRRTEYVSAYQIALIYAGLNESEPMLHWLDIAEKEFDPWMTWLRVDPRFDNFRSAPAFVAIQERIDKPR